MKGTESPELKSLNSSFKYLDGNLTDTTNALNWPHWRRASTWRTATYPQCFMFCGLSMRMASFILSSSGQPLDTAILWSSHCLGLLGVGWSTTWKQPQPNACESDALCKRKQNECSAWNVLPPSQAPYPPKPARLCSQWTASPSQQVEAGWWWSHLGFPSYEQEQIY